MTTLIRASCHCGLNTFGIPFSTNKLPIVNDLCHCNACRHSTGQLMVNVVHFSGVPLTPDGDHPADLSNLTSYKSSTSATRKFCSRCSCHILWEFNVTETPAWYVARGTLDRQEGISTIGYHIFVGDTRDGGITDHIKVFNGIELPRYAQDLENGSVVPQNWKAADMDEGGEKEHYLPAYCHCKAISLWITRPSSSESPSEKPTTTANPNKDEKWWLRPAGADQPTHYLASHCACTSCRLTSGFEIQSWAFIPRTNIFFRPSGHPTHGLTPGKDELVTLNIRKDDGRPAGLKTYLSSPSRRREFCATCGATVFWSGEERPDIIDLSVGLVDESKVGARAESWFDWRRDGVDFEEDAVNKPLVQALAEGVKEMNGL